MTLNLSDEVSSFHELYLLSGELVSDLPGSKVSLNPSVEDVAKALLIRSEFISLVNHHCVLSIEKAARIIFHSGHTFSQASFQVACAPYIAKTAPAPLTIPCERADLYNVTGTPDYENARYHPYSSCACDCCYLPIGSASFILESGQFGTQDWVSKDKDQLGEISQRISQECLAWSGENAFCEVCWSTRAFLFATDFWQQQPDIFLHFLRMYWQVPTPGLWLDLLTSAFLRADELGREVSLMTEHEPKSQSPLDPGPNLWFGKTTVLSEVLQTHILNELRDLRPVQEWCAANFVSWEDIVNVLRATFSLRDLRRILINPDKFLSEQVQNLRPVQVKIAIGRLINILKQVTSTEIDLRVAAQALQGINSAEVESHLKSLANVSRHPRDVLADIASSKGSMGIIWTIAVHPRLTHIRERFARGPPSDFALPSTSFTPFIVSPPIDPQHYHRRISKRVRVVDYILKRARRRTLSNPLTYDRHFLLRYQSIAILVVSSYVDNRQLKTIDIERL